MFPNKDNITNIEKYVEEGYISKRPHPNLPYFVYNYTSKCQYDGFWNEETLNCRGLVLCEEGNVIARSFAKFFNYGEYGKDSNLGELPSYKSFDVYDKIDGSLIIMTDDSSNNRLILTRGSFESEQALKAKEILMKKYPNVKMNSNLSYILEVIYPENRIVVDYKNQEDLVLLAIIENETGKDIERSKVESFARTYKFPCVLRYDFRTDLDKLVEVMKESGGNNSEGFVIQFNTGLRIKMKHEEYVRLHRIITGVNTKTVWEMLKDGQSMEVLLTKVPDEFHEWLENTIGNFEGSFASVEHSCKAILDACEAEDRKEIAKYFLLDENKTYSGVLFAMLDEKDYSQAIWKLLKPTKAVSYQEEQ